MREHTLDHAGTDTSRLAENFGTVVGVGRDGLLIRCLKPDWKEALAVVGSADYVLFEGFHNIDVCPRVICAKSATDVAAQWTGLEIAITGPVADQPAVRRDLETRYQVPVLSLEKGAYQLAEEIARRAFLLPGLNCGACGLTCGQMAHAIVRGERTPNDCAALQASVKVRIDEADIPLNPFVQKILQNVIIGVLRELKGFRRGKIRIEISR